MAARSFPQRPTPASPSSPSGTAWLAPSTASWRGEIEVLSEQHIAVLNQLLQSPRRQQHQQLQQGSRNGRKQSVEEPRTPAPTARTGAEDARPHCTYSGCDKPVGHWESTCLQKARDLGGRRQPTEVTSLLEARRLPMADRLVAPAVRAVGAGPY